MRTEPAPIHDKEKGRRPNNKLAPKRSKRAGPPAEGRSRLAGHRPSSPSRHGGPKDNGETVQARSAATKGNGEAVPAKRRRVPSSWLAHTLDEILLDVGLRERQFLYRYLGDRAGVHPTTILRYHLGELATAPQDLFRQARKLQRAVRMGEAITFVRGGDRGGVVVRERFVAQLDAILNTGLFQRKTDLFRIIEQESGLRKGLVERIYYDRKRRFVDNSALDSAAEVARKCEYDPAYTYDDGDRIIHPLFGFGSVVRKVPRDKLLVRFDDGSERELCENIKEDPYRRMR